MRESAFRFSLHSDAWDALPLMAHPQRWAQNSGLSCRCDFGSV